MGLGYVQFAFTDYSELCQVSLDCKTKVIKLGHFKGNMFDEFMKLINFSPLLL